MNWIVSTTSSAERQIKRLPREIYKRMGVAIESLKSDPWSGDVIKLGGTSDAWRRRVGEYRIKFRVFQEKHMIQVYEIERRTSSSY